MHTHTLTEPRVRARTPLALFPHWIYNSLGASWLWQPRAVWAFRAVTQHKIWQAKGGRHPSSGGGRRRPQVVREKIIGTCQRSEATENHCWEWKAEVWQCKSRWNGQARLSIADVSHGSDVRQVLKFFKWPHGGKGFQRLNALHTSRWILVR